MFAFASKLLSELRENVEGELRHTKIYGMFLQHIAMNKFVNGIHRIERMEVSHVGPIQNHPRCEWLPLTLIDLGSVYLSAVEIRHSTGSFSL